MVRRLGFSGLLTVVKSALCDTVVTLPCDRLTQVRDDVFLNSVQSIVNQWVKDIQRVTRLTETPFPDTVLEEVSYVSYRGCRQPP